MKNIIFYFLIFILLISQFPKSDNVVFNDQLETKLNATSNGVVIIDDLHENDYVSTDMNRIFDALSENNYIPFFVSDLKDWQTAFSYADYFIISTPTLSFSQNEIQQLSSWLDNGARSIFLSSRGDFTGFNFVTMNDLLSGIGSNIRVQNDNVYSTDASTAWHVETSNLQNDIPEIINGVTTISLFSPDSLEFTNTASVDVIAYGDADEYQTDQNPPAPNVIYDDTDDGVGGEAIPLIAHEELSNGNKTDHIIVSGSTVWSDFDYSNNPDNILFFNNIMSYFTSNLMNYGEIKVDIPDINPPDVKINFPRNNSVVMGEINISISATDAFGVINKEIYIDNKLKSNFDYYMWNTTQSTAGDHIIKVLAYDDAGNIGSSIHIVNVNQDYKPILNDKIKFMTYNIKESGINKEWIDVVKEENPDIATLVETGNWDDNNNQLQNKYLDILNNYYIDEVPYKAYTDRNTAFSTTGITILSRFDLLETKEINSVTLDDGGLFTPTHDFIYARIQIEGNNINIIGAHLKCCSGTTEETKRDKSQEGIINFMDSLGAVPIIYAGDLNSVSTNVNSDLGNGPVSMLLDPNNPHASKIHQFTDVYASLNNDPGYTYGNNARIDFVFVNQFLTPLLRSSTVGDTPSADLGSDHLSVDVIIDFSSGIPSITASITSSESNTKSTPFSNVFMFSSIIIMVLILKKFNKN